MVIAAVSIILQGKNFDISWSRHSVRTLNSMAFLLLLFRSGVLYTKETFRGLVVSQIMGKERQQIKCRDPYPPKTLSWYRGKNVCNFFYRLEQKSTQNLGYIQPILVLIPTLDYNVMITIINLVTKTFSHLVDIPETFNIHKESFASSRKVHKHYFSQ